MSDNRNPHNDTNGDPGRELDDFEIPVSIIDPVSRQENADERNDSGEESAEELRDRWLRAEAEIENIQKRTFKKIEIARNRERQDILASLLDVADSFERALQNESGDSTSWREGMKAIQQQLLAVLKRFGAEPMDVEGTSFDPNFHEAVAVTQDPGHAEDEIVSVMQTGYIMNDGALLRPAKVVVAKSAS